MFCLICILCFFPSLCISFLPPFFFFLNSLLSAKDCSLTLKCPSPASLPPTAFFFHPLFLIACAREQRKEKERIPSLCEIQERERQAGRQSCQPGRVRLNPSQGRAARLEHRGFAFSMTLAVPHNVALVLPALDVAPLQKCCFWHLLPQGNETGVRDGPKPPATPAQITDEVPCTVPSRSWSHCESGVSLLHRSVGNHLKCVRMLADRSHLLFPSISSHTASAALP